MAAKASHGDDGDAGRGGGGRGGAGVDDLWDGLLRLLSWGWAPRRALIVDDIEDGRLAKAGLFTNHGSGETSKHTRTVTGGGSGGNAPEEIFWVYDEKKRLANPQNRRCQR